MIKKILFVFIPMLFLFPFSSIKALEQTYSIDVWSYTYGGQMGDLNTGCSYGTERKVFQSNFYQTITLLSGGYCENENAAKKLGFNITTEIKSGYYYKITQTFKFNGSVKYLASNFGTVAECGIYDGTWNMSACKTISVSSTNPVSGISTVTTLIESSIPGSKLTFTIGSNDESFKLFYPVGSGGTFKLDSLKVESIEDAEVGALNSIVNQNQTIIDQNNEINNNLGDINNSITSDNVDDFSDSINSFDDFLEENSTITKLVTLPVTLYSSILNNINTTCTPFNLGNLYGEPLILPCINIGSYLGSTLWGMIDLIISGFAIYAISKKFIKIFNNFSTLKEGDILDD